MQQFVTSVLTGIESKIGEWFAESIRKQCGYLICHNQRIMELKEEHSKLETKKQELQERVEAEKRKGLMKISLVVQEWFHKVGVTEETELKRFYEDEANMKRKCLGGWCPNLASQYLLGREATKTTMHIRSLNVEKFDVICYTTPLPELGTVFTGKGIINFESRNKLIREIIEKLKNDKLERLSICGMGGVGKTVLVKEVIKMAESHKLFDKVAMAVVSQNLNYQNIQSQIADTLGWELKKESVEGRAVELHQRLKDMNAKVLIVLDDVWEELEFDRIGIPSLEWEHRKGCICKVIFTSRDEHVCHKMGSQNFNMSILSENEAWNLFREMAGGEFVDQSHIHSVATQVAKECRGLPLALVVVGKALRNKERSAWEDALQQLRKSQVTSLSDIQQHLFSRIELSYNILDSEHKSCLLLCGLFPEDFNIPIEVLMRYGVGMGYFMGVGELWMARNRVHTLVNDLKRSFLLLDSEKEECVKMHDVVRDVVIAIASRKEHGFMVRSNGKMEWPKDDMCYHVNAISLVSSNTEQLPNVMQYSNLKLLHVASSEQGQIPGLKNFLCGMSNLQVLCMQNFHIPKMLSLFPTLNNLRTLRVEDCFLGDISIIGRELRNLEILSFANSNIKILPTEIGQLSSLRLLDLNGCDDLYRIHSNVLARLSRLEELYFGVENFPWSQNDDVLGELKNLSDQMKVLKIAIGKVEQLPKELAIKNLVKFMVSVGGGVSTSHPDEYLFSKVLLMQEVNYYSIKCSLTIKQLAKECEILSLEKNMKDVIYELAKEGFPQLKDVTIKDYTDMEYLVDCSIPHNTFPLLESLYVDNLKNLKVICHASNHDEMEKAKMEFTNLINLNLWCLPSLIGFVDAIFHQMPQVQEPQDDSIKAKNGKLFTSNWMRWFSKLEEIYLDSCDSLEVVFDFEEYSKGDGHVESIDVFPQLKQVHIESLNELRYVWGNVPQYVQGFQNLGYLCVYNCDTLRYVFTSVIITALSQLEVVKIFECDQIEKLVGDDDNGEKKTETKLFSKLNTLELRGLKNLKSICSNSCELVWPSLKTLSITKCPILDVSSLLSKRYAKEDNLNAVSGDSIGFSNSKQDSPTSSKWCLGCTPVMAKLSKKRTKETLPKDFVPVVQKLEATSKVWSSCMPALEELYINGCDILVILFSLEENCHLSIPPSLKILQISECNKLEALIIPKDIHSFTNSALDKSGRRITNCEKKEDRVPKEEAQNKEMRKIVFQALQCIILEGLPNLKAFCQGSYDIDFPSLQEVKIIDCINMEVISNGSSHTPKLEDVIMGFGEYESNHLHMRDLNATIQRMKAFVALQKLETVMWREQDEGVLSYCIKEAKMTVSDFDKLLRVFLFNSIGMVQHLKVLTVRNCSSMAEVFELKGKDANRINCGLQKMILSNLQNLRHLCAVDLVIYFDNLRLLEIIGCNNLKSLFSSSMATSLPQLGQLTVFKCHTMKEIVTKDNEGGNNKVEILLPKLSILRLSQLPNLKCFCSGACHLALPSLTEFYYDECPQLTTFSTATVTTPQLHYINKGPYWQQMVYTRGDLNAAIYYIHNLENYKVELQKLETLRCIEQDQRLLGYIIRVTELKLEKCQKLLNCVPCNMTNRFQHLKFLEVKNCDSIKEIFESEGASANEGDHNTMQYELEKMYLVSLPKLMHIWKNQGGVLSFKSLTFLHISCCHNLKSVFPLSIARNLQQLTWLEVEHCAMMEEIVTITKEDEESIICKEPSESKTIFPKLLSLALVTLPSLESFYSGNSNFELLACESIFKIKLISLPKLKHIWKNQSGDSGFFQNLSDVKVISCHSLKSVLPIPKSRRLPRLKNLCVSNCRMMEEIVTTEDYSTSQLKEDIIVFSSIIIYLELQKLPSLNCFCASSCRFKQPKGNIVIKECPKMKTFCHGIVIIPRHFNAFVAETKYKQVENLNHLIQHHSIKTGVGTFSKNVLIINSC